MPEDPPACTDDAIAHLNGQFYKGQIRQCNHTDTTLVYFSGTCRVEIQNGLVYFNVVSDTIAAGVDYRDTTGYFCTILENKYRRFQLFDLQDNTDRGGIDDTKNYIHLIMQDTFCQRETFFQGEIRN